MFRRGRLLWAAIPSPEDLRAAFRVFGLTFNTVTPSPPSLRAAMRAAVRKQYRELARLHHPDLSGGDDHRMKVVNTAYELIQISGVLEPGAAAAQANPGAVHASAGEAGGDATPPPPPSATTRTINLKNQKIARRPRVPDDFASGDDARSSWRMAGILDWQAMMTHADDLTEAELRNPANHPFSHSKFFTFEEDVRIYRMLRGGATIRQVARTLGKTATFVERRLHNAQFKLRIRWLLRRQTDASSSSSTAPAGPLHKDEHLNPNKEKKSNAADSPSRPNPRVKGQRSTLSSASGGAPTPSRPVVANRFEPLLRTSPFSCEAGRKKREWEETPGRWVQPRYLAQMSMAEVFDEATGVKDREAAAAAEAAIAARAVASKVGRSYANYHRLYGSQKER